MTHKITLLQLVVISFVLALLLGFIRSCEPNPAFGKENHVIIK